MKNNDVHRHARDAERHPRPTRRRYTLPALEWTADAIGLCPRVTAIGGQRLLVENITGLQAFSETRIVLDTRSGTLCVSGDGLSLSGVRSGALIIRGAIRQVELPCEGGDGPDEG